MGMGWVGGYVVNGFNLFSGIWGSIGIVV